MSGYDQFFKAAKKAKKPNASFKIKPTKVSLGQKPNSETPEQVLRSMLKDRMKKKVKKANPPWWAFFAMATIAVGAGWGYVQPEVFEKGLSYIEVSWLGEANAQSKASTGNSRPEKTSQASGGEAAKNAEATKNLKAENNLNGSPGRNEDVSYFSKLNERKKELDLREAELGELEEELHKQRVEIEQRIKKVEEIRDQIAVLLKDKVKVDDQKVDKLVEFYSNMKPQQAAKVLNTMNEDLAVEILGRMKKKNAADVLNLIEADKAKAFSEKFAGYKSR